MQRRYRSRAAPVVRDAGTAPSNVRLRLHYRESSEPRRAGCVEAEADVVIFERRGERRDATAGNKRSRKGSSQRPEESTVGAKRVGRNEACPCGSGKKYKRCHGFAPARRAEDVSELELGRLEALERQRKQQQGLGRPILSTELNGRRFVAVGDTVYASNRWKTFHDFLMDYGRDALGKEWWREQDNKRGDERHLVVSWFHAANDLLTAGEVLGRPMNAAVSAYLQFAYDLFSLKNNLKIRDRLVQRLKNDANFDGARYELYVAAAFTRAGFHIEFEDEDDPTTTHCEFSATHARTAKSFSVEAKRRAGGSEASAQRGRIRMGRRLTDALQKTARHERVVFIDINTFEAAAAPDEMPASMRRALDDTHRFEGSSAGQALPPAYLFITNRPFSRELDGPPVLNGFIPEGFRIPAFKRDAPFRSIREAVDARDTHIEMNELIASMSEHTEVPATFDGEVPELAFGDHPPRLQIGCRYVIPDASGNAVPGTLESAAVLERERLAYGAYAFEDGRRVIATTPLTEAEIAAYKRHPDTFFGVVEEVPKKLTSPVEMYDLIYSTYRDTPKEKLLEFMAGAPDLKSLKTLGQSELARVYAERCAYGMLAHSSNG
jgi:hypothetical protein